MAVYYKFKSAKDYDSIPIEGQFISVANLKERIFESKHLGRGTDFDLMVSNAQTNEEYVDEAAMIPKNTSVLIRRVPGRPRNPIVIERDEYYLLRSRGMMEKKTPPAGYICHRCKVPGHFIQHCPTNGDPNYDIKRVKPPTGIPRSMLMATPDGSYALPSGAVAVLKPNEAAFEKEIEGLPSTRSITDLPPELRCPLCKEVMKDAVLTSRCCFKSFCDKCIRDYIINNSKCVCGATNILADDLLPNKTLRETISRILETTTSSTENAGSLVQVQDMESARPVQSRVPSPTLSSTSKGEPKQPPPADNSGYIKEGEGVSEPKTDNFAPTFLDKKSEKTMDQAEATPDLTNVKEAVYAEATPIPEEAQEKLPPGDLGKKKKKKKTRIVATGSDMQWRNFQQDFGLENFAGMPVGPSAYNPYWGNGMPIGVDGFIPSLAAPMPYMGYTPSPFDVPFGGILPPDPYAAQGYMMPGFPQRDLAELGMNGFGMNQGPPFMSREEFEARKAEMRRKREMDRAERQGEREFVREREKVPPGKESNSSVGAVSLKKAKPRLRSEVLELVKEKKPNMDRSAGPSPPPPRPPAKRKSSDREQSAGDAAATAKAERKQKGSVFSRISFPAESGDPDRATGKRRKISSDPPNGLKDHGERERERPTLVNGYVSSSIGRRSGGGGYEYESSDEERHFKRRSSSSRRESEEEEAARAPRVLRDREHRANEVKRR